MYPFPNEAYEEINDDAKGVLTIEMSSGQMIDDVRLSLNGKLPTYFYGRTGGMVPSPEEIVNKVKEILGGDK